MNRLEALLWGRGQRQRLTVHQIPRQVLALVDERQGGRRCEACETLGLTPPESEPLELDHRRPLSLGGDNHHSNLRWLCRSHNRARCASRAMPSRPRWARR